MDYKKEEIKKYLKEIVQLVPKIEKGIPSTEKNRKSKLKLANLHHDVKKAFDWLDIAFKDIEDENWISKSIVKKLGKREEK